MSVVLDPAKVRVCLRDNESGDLLAELPVVTGEFSCALSDVGEAKVKITPAAHEQLKVWLRPWAATVTFEVDGSVVWAGTVVKQRSDAGPAVREFTCREWSELLRRTWSVVDEVRGLPSETVDLPVNHTGALVKAPDWLLSAPMDPVAVKFPATVTITGPCYRTNKIWAPTVHSSSNPAVDWEIEVVEEIAAGQSVTLTPTGTVPSQLRLKNGVRPFIAFKEDFPNLFRDEIKKDSLVGAGGYGSAQVVWAGGNGVQVVEDGSVPTVVGEIRSRFVQAFNNQPVKIPDVEVTASSEDSLIFRDVGEFLPYEEVFWEFKNGQWVVVERVVGENPQTFDEDLRQITDSGWEWKSGWEPGRMVVETYVFRTPPASVATINVSRDVPAMSVMVDTEPQATKAVATAWGVSAVVPLQTDDVLQTWKVFAYEPVTDPTSSDVDAEEKALTDTAESLVEKLGSPVVLVEEAGVVGLRTDIGVGDVVSLMLPDDFGLGDVGDAPQFRVSGVQWRVERGQMLTQYSLGSTTEFMKPSAGRQVVRFSPPPNRSLGRVVKNLTDRVNRLETRSSYER